MSDDFLANAKPVASKDDFLANAKPVGSTPPPEGFWHSLGAQFGLTPEAAKAALQNEKDHPIKSFLFNLVDPTGVARGLYGQAKQSAGELGQAYQGAKENNPAAVAQHTITAVPVVGPALAKGADQYAQGDYAGEAGTILGASANAAPAAAGVIEATPAAPLLRSAANLPRQAVGRAALLGKTPEAAYEGALKPSTTLSEAQRTNIVKAGIENEIPVSKAGLESLGDLIDTYNQKIKAVIDSDPTRPIDPNAVAIRADAAKAKFAKQVNAGGDLAAIDASKQQFLEEQGASTPKIGPQGPAPPMNAIDAQEMKQGTYQVLKGKFGEQGSAAVEAQKALARGLKEEIANQFPEINDLNAAESRLLDLQPVLERAVNRISNHQSVGIGTPIAGAAAKAVTGSGSVGAVAGVLKAVLDNPAIKSRLAIMVSKGAQVPLSQAASRVQAYSAALGSAALGSRAYSSDDNPDQPTTPQP